MLNSFDESYYNLIEHVLNKGVHKKNRTGVDTVSLFGVGTQVVYSFPENDFCFPILTLRRVPFRSIVVELEGFLKGITDKKWYQDRGCTIWDEWSRPDETIKAGFSVGTPGYKEYQKDSRDLGPIYGFQLRHFGSSYVDCFTTYDSGFDQLKLIIDFLREDPDSRRAFVSYYNPCQLSMQSLPPCHYSWQVYTEPINDGTDRRYVSLLFNMRSCDVMLGLPFNIAHYALILILLARQFQYIPKNLIANLGDTHIYVNHFDAVDLIRQRVQQIKDSRDLYYPLPRLKFRRDFDSIFDFDNSDVFLEGYQSFPSIKMDVAV